MAFPEKNKKRFGAQNKNGAKGNFSDVLLLSVFSVFHFKNPFFSDETKNKSRTTKRQCGIGFLFSYGGIIRIRLQVGTIARRAGSLSAEVSSSSLLFLAHFICTEKNDNTKGEICQEGEETLKIFKIRIVFLE